MFFSSFKSKYIFKDYLLNFDFVFCQEPIPTSLLRINSDLISRAVKLFQAVLKYMGVDVYDRETPLSMQDQIELVIKLYKHTETC